MMSIVICWGQTLFLLDYNKCEIAAPVQGINMTFKESWT